MPLPGPESRVRRSRRLGVLLLVSTNLYLVALLLFVLWVVRSLARFGRTPTLALAAVAYALFVLAQIAHALLVYPPPRSLRRWMNQYVVLMMALAPLLAFVDIATFYYKLWWATLGSSVGYILMLWLVPGVAIWRRRAGGGTRTGGQG
jgi:hypothetical protein